MNLFKRCLACCLWLVIISMLATKSFSQTINISPTSLYFGKIPEGKEAVRDLLLFNISLQPLKINRLRIQGTDASLFSLVTDPGTVTLNLAEMLIVPIKFKPAIEGTFSAQIVVESNASTSPNVIEMNGEGTDLDRGMITFERIFGGPNFDGAGSVRITADGGYLIAGSTIRVDQEYSDAFLAKLDIYGHIEWSEWYGEEEWSEGFSRAISALDGGYICVGSHANSQAKDEPNVYIVKTDAKGKLLWQKSYGRTPFKPDEGSDIIPASDGNGYIIAGRSTTAQDENAYIIKIDVNGNRLWDKVYGGPAGENAATIQATLDGGYIFLGSTSSYKTGGAGDYDFYVVKIDASGNVIWEKNYGGSDWDRGGSLISAVDGGYLLSGWTSSPEFGAAARDIYLIKIDANGNKQWQKLYGWEHHDYANDIIATLEGGYLMVGSSERYYDAPMETWRADLYIIKIDFAGNEQWSKLYGGLKGEGASSVRQTSDGGYIVAGGTGSYSRDSDIYLLKLDRSGGFTPIVNSPEAVLGKFHLAQNYPNPFNSSTNIRYQLPHKTTVQITIYNIYGQIVRTLIHESQTAGSYHIRVEADDLPSGLYLYQIKTNEFSETKRMLLVK
ncbi:MAG: T9SS type A sorting domain-containing protein [candidate division KSB1 bacterium]|nr:T9SS type A sorting domain-containing protein [candidate division KSB1 bacterium]MDZ7335859.1 T9SS type A sorting domain-containing protein [candidate division KSB1 bacterium]MDZ7358386.1 T9SS type A sorting domain-containing protein [candidate division KSB1 bacterium]